MNKINRFANIELRAIEREGEENRTIEGYASIFNEETNVGGMFYEKIDRHAFDNCDFSDCYMLMNHDPNLILGGTQNGSLELSVDDKGLHQRNTVVKTTQGDDYLQLVKEGLIRKMSFGFSIDRDHGDEWFEDSDGVLHRTIKNVSKLWDTSIVTYPQYEGTSVDIARSENVIDDIAKSYLEKRSKEMNEEIREAEPQVEEVVEEPVEEAPVEPQVEEKAEEQVEAPVEEKAEEPKKEERAMETRFENPTQNPEMIEQRSTKAYEDAYVNAIRGNDREWRMLTSGMENAPIPTVLQNKIETAWEKADNIVKRVRTIEVRGIFAVPVEDETSDAVMHAEGTSAPQEESISLQSILLSPSVVKKWISYTDVLRAMTNEAFFDYLVDELIYKVYKKLNEGIIVGALDSASKGVVGVANATLTIQKSANLSFNVFNEADAELVDDGTSIVVMNKKTFMKNVLGLADTTGRPIYTIQNDLNGKPVYFANGKEVEFCSALKDYDSATTSDVYAVVGIFDGYTLNLPMGKTPTIIFDDVTRAKEDVEQLVAKLIACGNVTKKMHFVALKKSA